MSEHRKGYAAVCFKKLRGVGLPEEQQGLIRYTCLTCKNQPEHIKRKVRRLCDECGGEYSAALQEVMCSKRGIRSIALDHHVSESTLYRIRKNFYERW